MILTTRLLLGSSAAIQVLGALVAAALAGPRFGLGVLATGVVMVGNLWLWSHTGRALLGAAAAGRSSAVPALLFLLKLNALGAGLFVVGSLFPIPAVATGVSLVLGVALAAVAVGLTRGIDVGEVA
jgi:hypothetical protein